MSLFPKKVEYPFKSSASSTKTHCVGWKMIFFHLKAFYDHTKNVKLPPSSEVYWFRAFLVCPSEEGTMRVCVILINIWSRGEKKPAYTSNTCQMTLICVFLHCSQSICDSRRKED